MNQAMVTMMLKNFGLDPDKLMSEAKGMLDAVSGKLNDIDSHVNQLAVLLPQASDILARQEMYHRATMQQMNVLESRLNDVDQKLEALQMRTGALEANGNDNANGVDGMRDQLEAMRRSLTILAAAEQQRCEAGKAV